jgi:4-hydroxy-2-oxoglutarate aldolase
MKEFAGVFVPATTPFDRVSGDLDIVALRSNVRRLLATELSGVLLFGSTGEGLLLDEVERATAIDAVRELVPEKTLLIGVAAESTRAAIRMAKAAARADADAVLVAPPAYYRPQMTPEALREHYRAVADASPIPVLLYQVPPAYSGTDLSTGLVAELSNHGNIAGIKDSTGDLKAMGSLVESCRKGFSILVGSGGVLLAALEIGATGGIVAIANLAPDESAKIFALQREGSIAEAGRFQERMVPLHKSIIAAFGVPGAKAALDLLGFAGGPPRSPLRALREKDVRSIREHLERARLLPAETTA